MKKLHRFNKLGKLGIAFIAFAMLFGSCVPQKKMIYLKDAEMAAVNLSKEYVNERELNYKLQPGDNLYIRALNVVDERAAAAFNGEANNRANYMSNESSRRTRLHRAAFGR